jgi:hypothetical protein
MRHRGANLTQDAIRAIPPFVGFLKVAEARDAELGRPVIRARLLDIATGIETDVLPELTDAKLLWAENQKMRLTGMERIDKADFAQTWSVEFA